MDRTQSWRPILPERRRVEETVRANPEVGRPLIRGACSEASRCCSDFLMHIDWIFWMIEFRYRGQNEERVLLRASGSRVLFIQCVMVF